MIGETISHYTISSKLGSGGMGDVYKARDTDLDRDVAIKFLPLELTRDDKARQRFIHEARTASALDHPNICTIHEIGQTPEGSTFIVMACYEGRSLRQILSGDLLSIDDALEIGIQIAEGLSSAHEKGIVHRDIKPENIILTENGVVKILDFGLAKLAGQSQLTVSGTTLGTAAYMSPEQARGEELDVRSDQFSFGVILYEMFGGKHPFRGEHQLSLMYSIVNETPSPVQDVQPEIPDELGKIIATTLGKNADDRFDSTRQVLERLKDVRVQRLTSAAPGTSSRGVGAVKTKNKLAIGAAILLTLAVVAYGTFFFPGNDAEERRALARSHVARAHEDYRDDLVLAERELKFAVEIDPTYSVAWTSLAGVSVGLGKLDTAIVQARKAVELDPTNASAHYNLGYALEEMGRLDDALDAYAQASGADSTFSVAYSAQGNLLLSMDRPEEAAGILTAGVRTMNDTVYAYLLYRNLGRARYAMGLYPASIVALRRSIEMEPVLTPETRRYLALALEADGRKGESLAVWSEYLTLETDEALLRLARSHIAELGK